MSTFSLRDHLAAGAQPASPEALLSNKMYNEAASLFATRGEPEKAVAAACLCGNQPLILKYGPQATVMAPLAEKCAKRRPLDVADAKAIAEVLGITEAESMRQVAEGNVLLVASVSISVYLSTLDRVLAGLVPDSGAFVASLVRSGKLHSRVDQVDGTVKFLDNEWSGDSASRRSIYAQIDDLAKQVQVSDECF